MLPDVGGAVETIEVPSEGLVGRGAIATVVGKAGDAAGRELSAGTESGLVEHAARAKTIKERKRNLQAGFELLIMLSMVLTKVNEARSPYVLEGASRSEAERGT